MKLHPFSSNRPWPVSLAWAAGRVLVLVAVLLWAGQELLLFPGLVIRRSTPEARRAVAHAHDVTEVVREAPDGAEVVVWHDGVSPTDRVLLAFHGNGDSVVTYAPAFAVVRQLGWRLVVMEYRGFAGVSGWPTQARVVADAHAAWDVVTRELGVPASRVALLGDSLGGGVAAQLARDVAPGAVVLTSTFGSLADVAQARVPFLPVRLLLRSPFASAAALAASDAPRLVVHSTEDPVVPWVYARPLADARAHLVVVASAQHGGLALTDARAVREVFGWLEGVVPR